MELLDLAILILVGILWWATRSGASARKLADETIASLSAAGQSDREALAAKLCSATARARFALLAAVCSAVLAMILVGVRRS